MAFEWVQKKHFLIILAANALVLAVIIGLLCYLAFSPKSEALDLSTPQSVESNFVIEEKPYDINPNRDYVLYTNYACPYCAQFYNFDHDFSYTTRILILDKNSDRFKNQMTISSYMLKLYNENPDLYQTIEAWIFQNQNEWIYLNDADLITKLNELTGKLWNTDTLSKYEALCETAKREAPVDLKFVPGLYSSGQRHDSYVLNCVS